MSSISRKLSLHASALSDDEYQLYTTSLLSIVSVEEDNSQSQNTDDDGYFEKMNINVREARAWMRGRYSHISSLIIDKILKLFSPNLSPTDSLSGGEFFAVLRLVVHAENGKEVDRSLAFVQAQVRRSLNSVPPRRTYTDPSIATSSPSVIESSSSHNPFTSNHHPQPPLHPSQRSEIASHNPFVHRTLPPTRSDDGNAKLPPLPPRKPPAPPIPQPPSMTATPPKHHSHLDRSRSPSKPASTTNPLLSSHSHSHPPTIPPKPIHHITSTLIKQSLQATKAAQTMKKAEEQLERERVMQVLKSSSTVSGTNVYNQHQYQRQQRRSPSPTTGRGQGGVGTGLNRKIGYATSSTSSGSDERAPPLPKRRTQQPSPPLSISSLEQVALATTRPYPTSAPPSSTVSTFPNTESSNHAHVRVHPNVTSHPHPRSRDPVDSTIAIPYTSSPERSPRRMSLDLPSGGTTRGRPPPTHPDRKPHHLQHQHHPRSNLHSQSQSYSDPFAGSNLDFRDPPPEQPAANVDESFESIYGPSSSSPFTNPVLPSSPQTVQNPNRASRSKSLHQPTPPAPRSTLGRKRPESFQVFRASDVEEGGRELSDPPSWNNNPNNSGSISRRTSLMMPTLAANSQDIHRRSSLSISSTPSSSSSSVNHSGNWPPTSPNHQTQFGLSSSPSLTVTPSLAGPLTRPPSSTSSTMTMTTKHDSIAAPTPNPLTSLQKTFLQIQPHLDKARYKAEAGLSKRGFVRDGLRTRGRSGGVNGDVDGEEDGLEDGLEGLMGSSSDGGGKNQIGKSRWRVQDDGSGGSGGSGGLDRVYDREVDRDSDWTRSEGMSRQGRVQRQYSDGDEEDGDGLEKDNLKWPVASGEGWKPL